MLQLFQVSLAGPDCRQISHKDCNCSAERQTSLSSRIKAEQLSSLPSASFSQLQRLFVEMWRLLVGGGKNYNVESDFVLQVTVVLFHPQWQWCCFWLGSLLLWIIHLMRTKLQVTVEMFLSIPLHSYNTWKGSVRLQHLAFERRTNHFFCIHIQSWMY